VDSEPDPGLIASIADDVMKCLRGAGFFDKLDDLLCPSDASKIPERCSGDFRISESILPSCGFEPSDFEDIFGVLRSKGGCCDCEILYNAVETCRLKSRYWRARLKSLQHPGNHAAHRE
jgi:hypothetical protein